MDDRLKQGLAPVGSGAARLLLLGSLPGEASLVAQRYYAHPRNQFWTLLGAAIDEPLDALGYGQRLERLAQRQVALWDVIGTARRHGSLDGAIRQPSANPLARFVASHPALEAIAFNGHTAARLGRAALAGVAGVVLVDLPSSSPAYTLPVAQKLERWRAIGRFAGLAPPPPPDQRGGDERP